MILLTEIQCFGSISFWTKALHAEAVMLEQHERFQKSGYRNRYWILGANGALLLTIPVVGGRGNREGIKEVQIDNSEPWQKQHWRAMESAYNRSPFFLYYKDFLEEYFLKENQKYLWDFSIKSLEWVNVALKANCSILLSKAYERDPEPDCIFDNRGKEKPSNRSSSNVPVYHQVFGSHFEPNLCILDMLFNVGPLVLEKLKPHL
jgi:hypothetical protein